MGGEVILGTAASVAETLGYPGWWLGLKAAECLTGATQSGQSPYALDERIAEAGATSLWSPSAGPAESAVATVPTDETVELPKAPVKDWSQAVQKHVLQDALRNAIALIRGQSA